MLKKPYVVAIGSINIDEYIEMESWPALGDKAVARPKAIEIGGMISNFCCDLATQGVKVCLLNQFSDDQYLDYFKDELKKYNVDYSYSKTHKDSKSNKCIVANVGGERSILVVMDEQPAYTLGTKELTLLQNADYIYSTITDLQNIEDSSDNLNKMLEKGAKLVLDVEASTFQSSTSEKRFFDCADILIFNDFGFQKYLDGKGKSEVIDKLRSEDRLIVLTKGADGFEMIINEQILSVDGEDVDVVDTTGSGDMFNATLLAGLISGMAPEKAAVYANHKAAEHTTYFGPKARLGAASYVK